MKQNLLLLTFLSMLLSATAQTDTITSDKQPKPSIAIINTMEGKKIKGWLYKTDTGNVYLLPAGKKALQLLNYKSVKDDRLIYNIDALQINTIALKKKNAALKGTLIGLGAGIIVGAIAGFASGDDPQEEWFALTAGEKAFGLGIIGGAAGALIGVIAGVLSKTVFIIGGKKDAYRNAQAELNKRALVKF
jgi:hypothetical protein